MQFEGKGRWEGFLECVGSGLLGKPAANSDAMRTIST